MASDFSHYLPTLQKLGREYSLKYIRIFGSGVKSLKAARDVDLLIGRSDLSLEVHALLMHEFEKLFGKPIDLILPTSKVPGLLIQEIGSTSIPLWEDEEGRDDFARWFIPRLAIAADEEVAFPVERQREALLATQKRLHKGSKAT